MGLGVRKAQKTPGDAIAGLYVGLFVVIALIGQEQSVPTYPTRYTALVLEIKVNVVETSLKPK